MPPTSDRPLADKTLERLRAVSVATVTMQLLKRGLRHTFIQGPQPLNPQHARFAAEAYTLRTIPMREDLSTLEVLADPEYPQRKAIEACPPGQVLVGDPDGVCVIPRGIADDVALAAGEQELMEEFILNMDKQDGLYKAEVIYRRGPWRSFEAVELAALEWVDWFNNRRLLEPIGNIPPAEAEERHYAMLKQSDMAA